MTKFFQVILDNSLTMFSNDTQRNVSQVERVNECEVIPDDVVITYLLSAQNKSEYT